MTNRQDSRFARPQVARRVAHSWAFYGQSDVAPMLSATMIGLFFLACLGAVTYILRSGWRLRS